MADEYSEKIRGLTLAKALAIAAYGESVAAYRYRSLVERTDNEDHREVFSEMADEEQGHHKTLQDVLQNSFPGSDFVLSSEDKELVIVGPRLLEITDAASVKKALELISASEILTGNFYAALTKIAQQEDLKPLLQEMADECFTHAQQLKDLESTV